MEKYPFMCVLIVSPKSENEVNRTSQLIKKWQNLAHPSFVRSLERFIPHTMVMWMLLIGIPLLSCYEYILVDISNERKFFVGLGSFLALVFIFAPAFTTVDWFMLNYTPRYNPGWDV